MLQNGNWIVPYFNGQPYLRKPPLVNWAIALSIKTFGVRNEWTTRLPSVLAILAMALVMLAVVRRHGSGPMPPLPPCSSCSPAPASWKKGAWRRSRPFISPSSAWPSPAGSHGRPRAAPPGSSGRSPGCCSGLGLLAKGPPHLAFFYAIAGCIAWWSWRRKDGSIPTWQAGRTSAGIPIMLAVFALWCVPVHEAGRHARRGRSVGAPDGAAPRRGQRRNDLR